MAFRASNAIPQEAYRIVKGAAVQLKANLQGMNVQLAAADAGYEFLRDIYRTLSRADAQMNLLAATPGIAAYAQAQENDAQYDVVAEFLAMQAAINDAIGWMDTNVPTSGITATSPAGWTDGGSMIATVFTSAQTEPLRTALQAVVATID
jgi:hypothetical protein